MFTCSAKLGKSLELLTALLKIILNVKNIYKTKESTGLCEGFVLEMICVFVFIYFLHYSRELTNQLQTLSFAQSLDPLVIKLYRAPDRKQVQLSYPLELWVICSISKFLQSLPIPLKQGQKTDI